MLIQWSDEDEVFIVTLPEFDNARTHGETYEQAVRQAMDFIESLIMWYGQDGKALPQPRLFASSQRIRPAAAMKRLAVAG